MKEHNSKEVARAAIQMALTLDREIENQVKQRLADQNIKATAVDYGGEFLTSVQKVVERAVVAARRENIIASTHRTEGAVAGATREALAQIIPKAIGLNIGGKVGIARLGDHIAVAIFFGIGLLHLNEVSIGLGHRTI